MTESRLNDLAIPRQVVDFYTESGRFTRGLCGDKGFTIHLGFFSEDKNAKTEAQVYSSSTRLFRPPWLGF